MRKRLTVEADMKDAVPAPATMLHELCYTSPEDSRVSIHVKQTVHVSVSRVKERFLQLLFIFTFQPLRNTLLLQVEISRVELKCSDSVPSHGAGALNIRVNLVRPLSRCRMMLIRIREAFPERGWLLLLVMARKGS